MVETPYDGKYIKCGEIIKIAKFISSVSSDIRYRIDPLVQEVPKKLGEVDECIKEVKEILPNTYRIKSTVKIRSPKLLYPSLSSTRDFLR